MSGSSPKKPQFNEAAKPGDKTLVPKFFTALKDRDIETARQCLEGGMDPNARSPDSHIPAILYAIWVGSPLAEDLLAAGADINATDKNGRTAAHWAARGGHEQTMRLAIKLQGDINAADKGSRYTALHLAAGHGNTDAACLLIQHGADTSLRDEENLTALEGAIEEGQRYTASKMMEAISLRHTQKAMQPVMARRRKAASPS